MEWSHTLLGSYDIGSDTLAVDLARNFLDPLQAELVQFHEVTHAALGRTTDMGLATRPILGFIERFNHLDIEQKKHVKSILYESQVFPQEGFASLMALLRHASSVGRTKAIAYAKHTLPPDYWDRLNQLLYSTRMGKPNRDHFTQKVSMLSMENGFRASAPKQDLLRTPERLQQFLDQPDRNPSKRLTKINEYLLRNPGAVAKPAEEIARLSGITVYPPASKQEVADYMNYAIGLAGMSATYAAGLIRDAPGTEAITGAFEDATITNINNNFATDAEFLMSEADIDWEAEKADCAMVTMWPFYGENEQLIEQVSGLKPEVAFALFRRTGEKYTCFVPKAKAVELLEGPLRSKTLITKYGLVDMASGKFHLSEVKVPDLVYYDHINTLQATVEQTLSGLHAVEYLDMGTVQNHAYRILSLRVNDKKSLHVANAFGGAKIGKLLNTIKGKSSTIPEALVRNEYRDALNDYFGFMGLPWQYDWVGGMLDKKEIKKRGN
jgi:hypothetical protein